MPTCAAPTTDRTAELLDAYSAHGSAEAFTELYEVWTFRLLAWAKKRGAQPADAEDLAQGVFEKLIRGAHRWQASTNASAYIYRIANNHWIDRHRRASTNRAVRDKLREVATEAAAIDTEVVVEIRRAAQRLPPKTWAAARLFGAGHAEREVAARLGASRHAVRGYRVEAQLHFMADLPPKQTRISA